MSNPSAQDARVRVVARPAATPFAWLFMAALAAAFTSLVMWRATPLTLSAGTEAVEHPLADGSLLRLEPGSSARVIREFSLWWGHQARTRAVLMERGRGTIDATPRAAPFIVQTNDAHIEVDDARILLEAGADQGTRVTVARGRVLVTARDLMGAVRRSTDSAPTAATGVLAEAGKRVVASEGTLELMDDVAIEEPKSECVSSCSN